MSLNVEARRPPSPDRPAGVLSYVPGVLSTLAGLGALGAAVASIDGGRIRGPEMGAALLWAVVGLVVGGSGWALLRRPSARRPRRLAVAGVALSIAGPALVILGTSLLRRG